MTMNCAAISEPINEKRAIDVCMMLEPPTMPMLTEAAEKGLYTSRAHRKPLLRIQILTVEELLNGKQIDMPPTQMTFKQAQKLHTDVNDQGYLRFD